jgi:hypothetical protein
MGVFLSPYFDDFACVVPALVKETVDVWFAAESNAEKSIISFGHQRFLGSF